MRIAIAKKLRDRSKERRDPTFGMRRTFYQEQGIIPTGALFTGNRTSSTVTFALTVQRDTSGSNGLIFEIGGGPRGVAAYIDTTGLVGFGAGEGTGDEGVLINHAASLAVGESAKYIFACSAGDGWAWMWKNGNLVAFSQAVAGNFGGDWSASGDGQMRGDIPATSRIPAGQKVALANTSILGGMDIYLFQLPTGARRG